MTLLATFIAMHAICFPTTFMRSAPSIDSDVVSEVIYSEPIQIIEESGDWLKIKTTVDHYQGWTPKNTVCEYDEHPNASHAFVNRCAAHVYHIDNIEYGPLMTLPFESRLEIVDAGEDNGRWIKIKLTDGREAFIQRGDVDLYPKNKNIEEICEFSLRFLGIPYTWGGRSSFGFDCSGFVQMLYRQMGVAIPRDTKDQVKWEGFLNISEDNLKKGDVIFFGSADYKRHHVGMYLGEGKFIHTSPRENAPYVRISKFTDPEWNGNGYYIHRFCVTLNPALKNTKL